MKLTPLLRDHLFRHRGWPRVLALRRLAAAALVLLAAMLAIRPQAARDSPTVPTLVAAHDLTPGTTLHAADVRLVRAPEPLRPPAALTSPGQAAGRVLASATGAGEPITRLRLVGPEHSRLATGDPDAVAVPVRLADPEVATLLAPGTRVDVVTVTPDTGPELLATAATVVTIRPTQDTADRGRLVVIAVPRAAATRVAAASLDQPVAVTLR